MHRSTPSECWFLSCSQWVWQSSADSTFSVYEDEGEDLGRGTKIVLTLKAHTPSANRVTVVPLYSLDLLQPPSGLTVVSGWCTQEDCLEFLEEERLKGLIKRYSEFINFPIYLFTTKEEEEEVPVEEGDDDSEDEEEDDEEESEVRSPAPPLTPLTCAAALVPPSSSCPTRPRSLHPRRAHRLGGIRDAHMYSS